MDQNPQYRRVVESLERQVRRLDQRKNVKTLYILGAGSSHALSYVNRRDEQINKKTTPLDRDFLKAMYNHTPKRGWQKKSIELLDSNWLDDSEFWQGGLEKSIIDRVAHFEMLSSLHKDKARRKQPNSIYLNHLSHLITDYLWKCQSNNSGLTRKFVDHVFPKHMPVAKYENRVVTFNYDLIVDRPLLERGISRQKLYFDGFYNERAGEIKRGFKDGFPNPLLLKLHGSLNWRCTQKDFERIINGDLEFDEKIPVWDSLKSLPRPDDDESPLIIPPIPNKPIIESRLFRHLWSRFLEYVSDAQTIVIVGYSCPETDVMARSVFAQFSNRNVRDIFIVDPLGDSLTNYTNLMGARINKKVRWHYCRGFDEYLENEVQI